MRIQLDGVLLSTCASTLLVALACLPANAATTKVNGACGGADGRVLTTQYQTPSELCSAGTPSPFTVAGTLWDWNCTGSGGGSTVACRGYAPSKAPPPAPACNADASASGTTVPSASSITDCSGNVWTLVSGQPKLNGNPANVITNATQLLYYSGNVYYESSGKNWYMWSEQTTAWISVSGDPRSSGGSISGAVINGTCGISNGQVVASAPTTDLCTTGTATTVTGSGTFSWSCAGSNGGTTSSCIAGESSSDIAPIGTPSRIAFSNTALSLPLGTCGAISIVTENSSLKPVRGSNAITVTFSGASSNLELYSDSSCKTKSTSLTIPANTSTGTLYISGTKEGSYALTARASNSLGAASQTEVIVAPPAPACSGTQSPPTTPPSQAAAAGFNTLVFDDEFNSADTISPNGSGTYNWYPASGITAKDYTVSTGCLTILTDLSGYSDDLTTSTTTGYQHGYFEARLQFYPAGSQGGAWPAFWSYATEAAAGGPPFAELDFLEAYPVGSGGATNGSGGSSNGGNNGVTILTTIHQWTPTATAETGTNVQNSDITTIPSGFDYDAFHIYGCLWTTDSITWYIDNQPVMTVPTGPGTDFTAIEQDQMFLILGTGKNWPMTVDYVHVWH